MFLNKNEIMLLYTHKVSMTPYQIWSKVQIPSPAFKYLFGLSLSFQYYSPLYSTAPNHLCLPYWATSCPQIDTCSSPFALYLAISFVCNAFLCHSPSIYLLENQLKPAFPEAPPNLQLESLFLPECSVSPWHYELKFTWIYNSSIFYVLITRNSTEVFYADEVLKNLTEDLAKCLFLLRQPTFTCPYRTHRQLRQ